MYNLSTASSRRRCFVCALDFDGRRRRRFHERVEVHVVAWRLVVRAVRPQIRHDALEGMGRFVEERVERDRLFTRRRERHGHGYD